MQRDGNIKTLVVYVPETRPTVSTRFFESWVKMTGPKIQERLAKDFDTKLIPMVHTRFPLDLNRNQAVERALNDYKADYVQFFDADMTFPEETIPTLLSHLSEDFPVVSGCYWLRKPPYRCIAANYAPNEKISDFELKRKSLEREGFMTSEGRQTLYTNPVNSFDGPQSIDVSGMGCVLVRAGVFTRLSQPYFKYVNAYSTGGDYTFDVGISEDMWFYSECKKAGINVLLDPTVKCGHLFEQEIMGNPIA